MKTICSLIALISLCLTGRGQTNCTLFTNPRCALACRLYNASDSFGQGWRKSQEYLDSAIHLCPEYADAWHEISVPYLKRGDFLTWRKYIDVAVALKPEVYLLTRGWCRFKFLRDYEGALDDFKKNDTITNFTPGQTGDGSYNTYVVMAICERELGHYPESFIYFSKGIDSVYQNKGIAWVGLYDYVHRAVARIRLGDYKSALSDLDSENKKYESYAETWYYMGIVYRFTDRIKEAKACFEKAKRLFNGEGYHFSDPYCEMTDAIYLSDIDKALQSVP